MPVAVGKDESVMKNATCRSCGTINRYSPGEVREFWRGLDYTGSRSGADGFNCVNCGNSIVTKSW